MRRWRSYYFLVVPVALLMLFFQYPRLNQTVHSVYSTLTKPMLEAGSGIRSVFYTIRYQSRDFLDAIGKQKEYLSRIQELETQLLHFHEMERENQRLRKLLNFSAAPGEHTIGARVIGQDGTPWKKVLELDKGSRQNIKRDMAVIAPEGLVGRILEADHATSSVILLVDPDCRVSALTATSRAQGVITGIGTEKLQMKYLALDAEIAVGEDVTTSGIGSIFPKGIQIGKIESIERDSDGLHLLALVNPAVPFSKLEEVLCLVSSPQK